MRNAESSNKLLKEIDVLRNRSSDLEQKEKKHLNKISNLREVNHLLSLIIDNLPGMAYLCAADKIRTLEFVSSGCYEITGYKPVDLIGDKKSGFSKIIHHDDRKKVLEEIQKAINTKEPFEIEYRIETASDDVKQVKDQGQGVYSDTGEFILVEGFITEID